MARPTCVLCFLKHAAQAQVLFDEAVLGYPIHRYLAFGHMAEAESEMIEKYLPMAEAMRAERVRAMEDPSYSPTLLDLMEQALTLEEPTSPPSPGA